MNNTTIPAFEQQAYKPPHPSLASLLEKIEVGGNVDGTLLVGNENIVGSNNVVYNVSTGHGAVVNIAEPTPSVRPRTMHGQPLVPPPHFTGRKNDLELIGDAVRRNEKVLLYGPDGIGKTALLAQASNGAAARAKHEGVVFVEGIDEDGQVLGLSDIIQRLFDSLFDSNPPLKVTYPTARIHLSNTEPVVILDHLTLPTTALNRLPGLFSGGAAVLVTSQETPSEDWLRTVPVLPLARADSIQMLSSKVGISLDETTHDLLDQICDLLGDVPLAIAKTATAIRQKGWDLKTVAETLAGLQPPSQDPVQAAIERSIGLIYSTLNQPERKMLAITAAAPGNSVDRPWLESVAGGPEISRALEDLELLYANSPRLRMPDGIREVLQPSGKDLQDYRELLLRHLLDQWESRLLDFKFVADELGNLLGLLRWAANEGRWSDVIALGRTVDPYLTLSGLWDAWETVLEQVLVAAQNLKDHGVRGWAFHQLGTRAIGVGTRNQAISLLRRALKIRLARRDIVGAAYTLHNLRLILPGETPDEEEHTGEPGGKVKPDDPNYPGSHDLTFWEKIWRKLGNNIWTIASGLLIIAAIAVAALQPAMRFKIQASPTRYSPSGQVIEYSYIVDNSGFRQLAGPISVTTEDQADVICPDLDSIGNEDSFLDWNETLTCTSFYTTSEADVQKGSVTNTATASAGDSGVRSTQSLTLQRDDRYVLLNIQTDPLTFGNAGETITVAYLVNNVGKEALSGLIAVTGDPLQVNCPSIQQASDGNNLLEAGESLVCTSTYMITDADVQAGSWTNTASVRVGDFKSDPQTVTIYGRLPSQLTLKKSAKPRMYEQADEQIRYTYEIANQGKDPLSGPVTVSDDKLPVNCPDVQKVGNQDNFLDPGELLICSATYSITDSDVENGSVTNTAVASTEEMKSEPQSVTLQYRGAQTPPLGLIKSADPVTYKAVGQEIRYTYEVTNQSKGSVEGPVTVSDDRVQVACAEQDNVLDPGEVLNCSATYVITEADIKNGSVTNTASASVGDIRSEEQLNVINFEMPLPVLFKSVDPKTYEYAGQEIRYTYVVTNPGMLPMNGFVTVEDDKLQVTCSQITMLVMQDSVLNPGESFACTGTYVITDADMQSGSVTNTAWASVGGIYSDPKSVTIFEGPVPPAILRLTKSAKPKIYREAGEQITYTYFITNAGKGPAKGPVTVQDDGTQAVCPPVNEVGDRNSVLDPDERLTCTAIYTITNADIENGSVTNTASAQAGRVRSNPSSETIYAKALNLTGAANPPDYAEAGKVIQYTYAVTSQSKMPLPGPVTVTDNRIQVNCDELSGVGNGDDIFDWNEKLTCKGSYSVIQSDIDIVPDGSDHGSLTNTASASAGDLVSNRISITVQGPMPRPELALTQTADPMSYDSVGQVITYTYAVTNTGNVTLSPPVQISNGDVRNGDAFDCGSNQQGLTPKEPVTCTETYTIVQADFGSKSITKSATASGMYQSSIIKSPAAETTITCPAPPVSWIPYTVESGVNLTDIDTWYAETMTDLQKANCMGSSDYVFPGQIIYVPGAPPSARVSGIVRDTGGVPLDGIRVQLISNGIVIDRTTTDGDGSYALSAPNPGTYQIFRLRVTLRRGDNPPQDFVIVPVGQ